MYYGTIIQEIGDLEDSCYALLMDGNLSVSQSPQQGQYFKLPVFFFLSFCFPFAISPPLFMFMQQVCASRAHEFDPRINIVPSDTDSEVGE